MLAGQLLHSAATGSQARDVREVAAVSPQARHSHLCLAQGRAALACQLRGRFKGAAVATARGCGEPLCLVVPEAWLPVNSLPRFLQVSASRKVAGANGRSPLVTGHLHRPALRH